MSLLVAAGFAAVLATRTEDVSDATLTYGAVFLGLCVFAHLFIRARLPDADPYMFPLAALLAAVGLVVIYRIDPELAREQAQWFVVGLALFCATILLVRDHHVLERYRYTIAAVGIALLVMPRMPGIGEQVNGAFLAIKLGPIQFQPAEFAKLGDHRLPRELPARDGRHPRAAAAAAAAMPAPAAALRAAGGRHAARRSSCWGSAPAGSVLLVVFVASLVAVLRERPSPKHFGPLLLVWGLAMLMLIFIRDLGSSLMFFGGFLALLYVATARLSLVGVGATMFFGGAFFFASNVAHVAGPRAHLARHPSSAGASVRTNARATRSPSRCSPRPTAAYSGRASARRCSSSGGSAAAAGGPHRPDLRGDRRTRSGLFGAAGVIGAYLLFAYRGFKTAMLASDGFSKLLAAGLTAVFALQVFVIVGGVTRVIPLTGVTLPFVSYGGSSIVANMVLLALLLIVSDHARAERIRRGGLV